MAVGVVEGKKHAGIWISDILAKLLLFRKQFLKRY